MSATIDATIRSYFESLYRPQKLRFKKPSTAYKYRLELDRLDRFLKRPGVLPDLTDVTIGDAAEFILAPEGCGLSVESTRGFIGRISRLWDFLARKRIVSEFPTLENLRKQKRTPRAWTREQLATLWDALQRQPGRIGDIPASDWFCSLHAVLWCSGERIGALLRVRWQDLALADGWLTIQPEDRKGGCKGRVYRLSVDALEWLGRLRQHSVPGDTSLVWPWPMSPGYLWRRYHEILNCAGLPSGRERMFHCVRKSHASHLEAAGGNATESLGHSGRQTTIESYLDPRITGSGDQSNRLFRLGSDPPEPPRAA